MLKNLAAVAIRIYPFHPHTACAREFLSRVNTDASRASNPDCKVEVEITNDGKPPVVALTFLDGQTQEYDASRMNISQMMEEIEDMAHIVAIKEVEQDMKDMYDEAENDDKFCEYLRARTPARYRGDFGIRTKTMKERSFE